MNADFEARSRLGNPDNNQEPLLSDEVRDQIVEKLGSKWIYSSEFIAGLKIAGIKFNNLFQEEEVWMQIIRNMTARKRMKIEMREIVRAVYVWEELGIYPDHIPNDRGRSLTSR